MTTLHERPNTALLVIDAQTGVFARVHDREAVVSAISNLVGGARDADIPVIWVRHNSDELPRGEAAWEIIPELGADEDEEAIVDKRFGDAFEDTTLETALEALGVGRLVVAGGQTDGCIRATIHGAFARGYDVTLVSDAHTTEDLSQYGAPTPDKVIAHTNLYWKFQTGPGRTAQVLPAGKVQFAA